VRKEAAMDQLMEVSKKGTEGSGLTADQRETGGSCTDAQGAGHK